MGWGSWGEKIFVGGRGRGCLFGLGVCRGGILCLLRGWGRKRWWSGWGWGVRLGSCLGRGWGCWLGSGGVGGGGGWMSLFFGCRRGGCCGGWSLWVWMFSFLILGRRRKKKRGRRKGGGGSKLLCVWVKDRCVWRRVLGIRWVSFGIFWRWSMCWFCGRGLRLLLDGCCFVCEVSGGVRNDGMW